MPTLWRIHGAFDLPSERFGFFELTDEKGGETLDRTPVIAGEIRLGDRAYLQPDRMAGVFDAGGDLIVMSTPQCGERGASQQDRSASYQSFERHGSSPFDV